MSLKTPVKTLIRSSTRPLNLRPDPRPILAASERPHSSLSIVGASSSSASGSNATRSSRPAHLDQTVRPSFTRAIQRPGQGSSSSSFSTSSAARSAEEVVPEHGPAIKELTESEYEDVSDEDMDTMYDKLEVMCEEIAPDTWEVEYSSGVMTLHCGPHGIYVINKQPPNQQIWVSSPLSGPARFGYSPEGTWIHHRKEGISLGGLLEGELRGLLRKEVDDAEEDWEGIGLK